MEQKTKAVEEKQEEEEMNSEGETRENNVNNVALMPLSSAWSLVTSSAWLILSTIIIIVIF